MISYEEAQKRLNAVTENGADKVFYFQGHIPVVVNRKNYKPNVYDGRAFYGFETRK